MFGVKLTGCGFRFHRSQTDGLHYFFKSAVQFKTTAIGAEVVSPIVLLTRNFCPSAMMANRACESILGILRERRRQHFNCHIAIQFLVAHQIHLRVLCRRQAPCAYLKLFIKITSPPSVPREQASCFPSRDQSKEKMMSVL